jgi:hypothetical protein
MFYCWWVRLPRRHRHFGRWHRHIHRLIGHGHGHVFWAVGGAVGAATAVLVCTAIGPGLWHPPPHFSQPHGGPGLAPEELSAVPAPFIGGPGLSGGAIGDELAAAAVPGIGNGLGAGEINQIGNLAGQPGSIEAGAAPAVAVIGQVPEPSSALILSGAVLAMALLRAAIAPSSGRRWPTEVAPILIRCSARQHRYVGRSRAR